MDQSSQTPLVDPAAPVRIYGRPGSSTAYTIRDFLHRSDVPFEWIPLADDADARQRAGVESLHDSRLPLCVFPDGTRMTCPTVRQITEKLGWFHDPCRSQYDLAIYGAGPAGLSAAVYAASEGLKTVVIERSAIGGQAGTSSKIENYLGFPDGISGNDLAVRAREQASRFGAEFLVAREGVRAEFHEGIGTGFLADGTKIVARASLCSTGVVYSRLGVDREDDFLGSGVYYGAGASEALLCRGTHVFVVGGGNSAGQAAMHFSRYASKVSVLIRDESLRSTLSNYLVDRITAAPNIEVIPWSEVTGLIGGECLDAIRITNRQSGKEETVDTHWLFVCIGGAPQTEWAAQLGISRDAEGYLMTGPDLLTGGKRPPSWPLERNPYYLETSSPGLFAAGDVRHGSVKRCASAVGEGAMSIAFVHRYLNGD